MKKLRSYPRSHRQEIVKQGSKWRQSDPEAYPQCTVRSLYDPFTQYVRKLPVIEIRCYLLSEDT